MVDRWCILAIVKSYELNPEPNGHHFAYGFKCKNNTRLGGTFHKPFNIIPYIVTVYPKKYAHGFCFAVLCCGYTLTDFPISIRLTSLALWQSNDCPSANKATLMNMDKYFMGIHYKRLHNHNKAKHNKTVCIFLGIYCICIGFFCWPHITICALDHLLHELCMKMTVHGTLMYI